MSDAPSPASSDLSEPPSIDSEPEDTTSTAAPSPRPSLDTDNTPHPRPAKRRKTANTNSSLSLSAFDRAPSSQPGAPDPLLDDDTLSLSSDGWSDCPGSPSHSEWALRDEAQTVCLWRDCPFGEAGNNDDLVAHVQATHCATGGPKRTKYVCEWGECQRKTSNHPSGYALKAHMRSHTKEKPYYCLLPECDKAFTRSDALAKHMRTVHEPEQPRTAASAPSNDPTPPGSKKSSAKVKLTNGSSTPNKTLEPATPTSPLGPTHDEDGNPITPSHPSDNITYIAAHHPLTGQPGFMIHYPPDIQFTQWESAIAADQLMRLLRRQVRWAELEQAELKKENEELEQRRREEWGLKEILIEGVMEAEFARGEREGLLSDVGERVRGAMEEDVKPARELAWTPLGTPEWRREAAGKLPSTLPYPTLRQPTSHTQMDVDPVETPPREPAQQSPSPPPTGRSAGFDGEGQPYDNYLADRMAEMERLRAERRKFRHDGDSGMERRREEADAEAEADAVGALMGMSGGH